VKLQFPREGAPEDERPKVRTYTVREWDAERGLLTIDFVVHGAAGIAGPWAAAAAPGDTIALRGPGGGYAPDPEADWHLLAGDTSVIPAISVSLARIPAGRPVHVFLQVDGPEEHVALARRHLVLDRAVPAERLSASGYWKRTLTDEGWREAKAAWNAQVESET
jgi:NADPH-dependent ferric siderophore reductase